MMAFNYVCAEINVIKPETTKINSGLVIKILLKCE